MTGAEKKKKKKKKELRHEHEVRGNLSSDWRGMPMQ